MTGAWRVLVGLATTVGMFVFWMMVIIVIPGLFAIYGAALFPLTGQWREKFRNGKKGK